MKLFWSCEKRYICARLAQNPIWNPRCLGLDYNTCCCTGSVCHPMHKVMHHQHWHETQPLQVYLASASPPVRFPNVYGVDMPTKKEFVATDLSEEEICKVMPLLHKASSTQLHTDPYIQLLPSCTLSLMHQASLIGCEVPARCVHVKPLASSRIKLLQVLDYGRGCASLFPQR